MSRKKIGIVGHFNADQSNFGIGTPYMLFFTETFNADVEIISPTELTVREHLDLIVVPGGPDVDYKRYLDLENDTLSLFTGRPCNIRERFDEVLLPKYIEAGIPIFGICRGHQSIAVLFGSQLVQDMHHETNGKDRKELMHDNIFPVKENINAGYTFEGKKHITHFLVKVNSIHHQVVKDCPDDAVVLARYNGKFTKKYIEALHYPEHKIITVQWHPEEIHDVTSIGYINYLLTLK